MFKATHTCTSFASKKEGYMKGQITKRDGRYNFQIPGIDGNRSYGLVLSLPGCNVFDNKVLNSLSGTDRKYTPAQALFTDGVLHVQVQCNEINRDYGYVFDVCLTASQLKFFVEPPTAKELWYTCP